MATKKFNLREWMGEHREVVIAKYEKLTKERFFDQVTLRTFMYDILNLMAENCRSAKSCEKNLGCLLEMVYYDHCSISGGDFITDRLVKKYEGKAEMALI